MSNRHDILCEFAGWFRIPADQVNFQDTDGTVKTAQEWLDLGRDIDGELIFENVVAAMNNADDLEYDMLETTVEENE